MIVAIGAQNVFVLRQGIRREHVLVIVAICALSDAVLIGAAIAGTGAVIEQVPWVLPAVRIGGALFLTVYGSMALRRAFAPQGQSLVVTGDGGGSGRTLAAAVGTTLAVTWLNPHVYLDIAILGSLANSHGDARWLFGAGMVLASGIWFTLLGFGARALAPVFARPRAWRILDTLIGAVMLTLAALVLLPLLPPLSP
ncbi:amino acid transporter [Homoserinibacter sp. GY 40078]|nr:amino acid transporter [Homoserinibacter sp. GY 40078]